MPYSLAGTATAFNAKKPSKSPQLQSPKLTFGRRTASENRQKVDLGATGGHAGHRRPGQAASPAGPGRPRYLDVVIQTPQRFSDAFLAAVEAELPVFAPAMVRALSSVGTRLWELDAADGAGVTAAY